MQRRDLLLFVTRGNLLRFLQGLNVLETARVIGKSEDAVKKLQSRGLLALRRVLGVATLAELAA